MGTLFSYYGRNGLQGSFFCRLATLSLNPIQANEGPWRISRQDADQRFGTRTDEGRSAGGC